MKTQIQTRIGLALALTLALLGGLAPRAEAVDRYWIRTTPGDWNVAGNWSTVSGGGGTAGVPGAGDVAYFDGANGANGDCNINAAVNVTGTGGINIGSGYGGTITQGAFAITVGSAGWTQAGGTFTGSGTGMTLNGAFALSGGTFNAGSQTITIVDKSWTVSGGTLNAQTSTVKFDVQTTDIAIITGSHALNNVTFYATYGACSVLISVGTTLSVDGTLTFQAHSYWKYSVQINGGTVAAKGNIVIASDRTHKGTGTLLINGTGDQTFSGVAGGYIPHTTINKPSGTLTLSGTIAVTDNTNWTYISGTIDPGTSTVKFSLYGNNGTGVISGSHALNNVTFDAGYATVNVVTIAAGTTLTVNGTLTYMSSGGWGFAVNTGTIHAKGNIVVGPKTLSWADFHTGTATLIINGTGDQTFTGIDNAYIPNVTINKPSGTLTLSGTIVLTDNTSWTYTAGNLDAGTSTVKFYLLVNNGTGTITGSHALNNVTFQSGYNPANRVYIAVGTTLSVNGTLTFTANSGGGGWGVALNTGTLEARGNVVIEDSGATYQGTTAFTLGGSANQTITSSAGSTMFRFSPVTVNKTGGAVTLAKDLNLDYTGQQLVWTNGALNLSSNTLTVAGATTIYPGATTLGVTVADTSKAGRLTCKSAISGVGNVGLAMTVSATEAQTSGQTYMILTNTAVLSSQFKSVSWPGLWIGDVSYASSGGKAVTVTNIHLQSPGIYNLTANSTATNSASLTAVLVGTNADVYVYWDTQDRGTNFTWAYTNSPPNAFANTPDGTTITNTATGLTPGTSYSYRFYGTNTTSGWSGWSSVGSFTTLGPPTVDNTNGASGLGVGTATLNGRVTSTNGAVCYGQIFWGPADGSNNPTAWAYTNDISGAVTQGVAYAVTLSNLLYGQQYYYRAAASNSYGLAWATNSVGFLTAWPLGPSVPGGYVIRYTFENAGTTTVTNDGSAGATYDGTLVSTATLPTIANGVGRGGGKALSMLTGTSRQAVQIGSSASSGWGPNGGVYTLSLWFYGMYDASGYRTAFKRNWSTDEDMYITHNDDTQNMEGYSGGFKNATTQFSMKPYRQGQPQGSSWHMLTFVATNSATQMYVDGVAAGSTIPWVFGVNIGTIGGNQNQDNRNFAQYLDDVYIYGRALTSNEVVSLYQNPNMAVVATGISNLTASGGTSTSAVLNATLQGTGSVFTVSAYYWEVGAGSSNVAAVGTYTNVASTNLSVTVTDLTPGTSYDYTFLASNAATNLWASPALSFTSAPAAFPPQVQNRAPTGVMTNGAAFNGALVTNGTGNATVYVAWGQTNGAVSGSWAATNWWNPGDWTNGSYPSTNMTLAANANYYYTFGAANVASNVVASGYQYLITGEVTVQPTDPTGRVTLTDTAAFTVYRPASCTNEAITVAYTLGGTATNNTHYTNSPAPTLTNGTVTLAAGQTNTVITVYPLNVSAPQQTVVLSLVSSNYAIGSANSATCTLAAIGATYYTSQTGDWNLSARWGNAGPPSSGDQGVVRHGSSYGDTVLATTNLGAAGNYATITVATNGWVSAKAAASSTGTIIANPVIFDGGKIGSGAWDAGGGEWTGPITITTNGLISAPGRWGSPKLSGKVSGPGGITLTTPDQLGSGGLQLNNPSNDFLGNVVVTEGTLSLACDLALPTGKVVHVYSAGKVVLDVSQTYASEPPPIVNLYGGALGPQVANAVSVTNGLVVNVSAAGGTFNGGKWNSTGSRATGPIAIAAGGTLHVDDSRGGSWALDGPISGAGTLRFFALSGGSLSVSVIAGTNNTHSGGTLVATFGPTETHTTIARTEGSLGTGPVTVETNTIMALDKTVHADWTLTNTLAGAGTFKVEDGSTSYRLTAGGTVSPGTNTGHTAILRVDGKFAFAKNGGTPSTLAIDVASVGTTPGVNHDQFTVDHPDTTLASSITNCTLVLNRVPTPTAMNGQTLTILSAPGANFSSYQFASVPDLGAGGSVVYGEGSITLTWTAQTPIINNGAFSNLAATSCDVSGYLSSTGDTPTTVRCYYGTNSAGTSGWGYTNDLGTRAVGTVGTSLTGLTSNVKYYYRFYATNDAGDYWSVATSNFTTLADINWNDAASGNWNAGNANTWGAGANVYPQNPLNDHVTVDSHVVTVTSTLAIVAADVTLTTSGSVTGTLAFVNADVQNQAMILDGGRLGVYSDDNGTFKNVVLTNGNLRVKSASQLHLGTHGNRANGSVSTLYGNIEDYGSGTTGVLRVDCDMTVFPSQGFGAAGRLVYNGVSTNFTGGWLIQSANAQALDGGFWLGVYQDGGLGASTVTVTRGQLLINATQSGAAPRPAPARVIVNPEGRLLIGSGVNVTNWTVDFNGGQMWWYGASKYAGGTLAMNANSTWWGATAGNKEYAGTISGAGRLDINPTGGSGPFILSGNNSGFSGGIRLLADSVTASHTNGLGTGPVLLASQSGGKLTLDRPSGNFDWTLANNLSGGCTNGSTAVVIQVEDGVGTNTLTVLGTVDPGTNTVAGATNIMGILRVDGDLAFGAGSRLKIDISGTNGVAGVDFDRLVVDHDLTVLGNAVLEVNVNTNLAQTSLQGQALVVVSNATTMVGTFGSVQWSGRWTGQVTYNDPPGTVKLSNIEVSQGSVFRFR